MNIKLLVKKIKCITFLSISIVLFSSCQMTERMTINKNGTGKISFQVDGSALMNMMGDKMSKKDKKTKYDSIIHFKDILKEKEDSIKKLTKDERRKLKKLENFSLKISMDNEAKKMKFDMFTEFKNVKEVNNMLNSFQDGFSLASKTNNKLLSGKQQSKTLKKQNKPTTKISYYYTNKKFKRITKILDPDKLQKEIDSLGDAKSMFATSKYKLIYTFPKAIKSASIKDIYFSSDRKTITIEKGFIEYLSNPKILDFSVEFER